MWWKLVLFICCRVALAFSVPTDSVPELEDDIDFEWYQMLEENWLLPKCELQDEEVVGQELLLPEQYAEQAGKDRKHCKVVVQIREKGVHSIDNQHASPGRATRHAPPKVSHDATGCFEDWDWLENMHQLPFPDEWQDDETNQAPPSSLAPKDTKTIPDLGIFVRPQSPKDFAERWPAQRRLFKSLPHPRTPEQDRALRLAYYPFTAAGRLLDELGKKEFLQRYGRATVVEMRRATVAENKQRKAAWEEREVTEDENEEDSGSSDGKTFVKFRSPKHFVKNWLRQVQLFQSLPHPFSPEQKDILKHVYYAFVAAGLLLEELGEEEFLKRYGGGSVNRMQKATAAEIRQRKMAKKDQEVAKSMGILREKVQDMRAFVTPTSPEDFVKLWPGQQRLFQSLPRPLTTKQIRVLTNTYYRFTATGQLLDELGEKRFLKRFGKGTVYQMQNAATDEVRQKKAMERGQRVAESARKAGEKVPSIDALTRPISPEDFVKRWPEQKRIFESLPRPLAPEQRRRISSHYYPFTAVGQLLEELGREKFLKRFKGCSVTQMWRASVAEMRQRKSDAV